MRRKGIAIVTALVLMTVLIAVVSLLTVDSLGELKQNKNNVIAVQAGNVAQAGANYGSDVMQGAVRNAVTPLISNYVSDYIQNGGNPRTDPVIPKNNWNTVASAIQTNLQNNYSDLTSSQLGGAGRAHMRYYVKNFRLAALGDSGNAFAQSYTAEYKIVSTGYANSGKRRAIERGYINITLGRPSLSQWLFLVEDAGGRNGFFDSSAVFNGPVHANSNWGFLGTPTFTGAVTSSDGGAWFWNPRTFRRQFINAGSGNGTSPDFQRGYDWNVPRVNLPTNTLSQQRAALGLAPDQDDDNDGVPDPPSAAEICQQLQINPCHTPANGVYLPNDGVHITGGIYVQGDLDSLQLSIDGQGGQFYTLKQGGRTWTIRVNYPNNTTTITYPSGTTKTLSGVPNGHAPLRTGGPTGQIYVNGGIGSVTSPSRNGYVAPDSSNHPPPSAIQPALSLETQLNITARNGIGISGDLIYECDPNMMSDSSYLGSHPRCASHSNDLRTVLGMFSENDDITILRNDGMNDIYLWGSFLSAADGKGLAVEDYDSRGPQGTMHLFGGVIQWQDQLRGRINRNGDLISGYHENFDYDRRFANSNLTPPNFPTTRAFQLRNVITQKLFYQEQKPEP